MASRSQRKFGEDAQRGGDSFHSWGEVPERDPALGRSQQPFCQVGLISRVIAALNRIGKLLVEDPCPAAVTGHPQAVRSLLADSAGKRVRPAPLALRRGDQLDNPGGAGAEISRYQLILSRLKGGLDLAPTEPRARSPDPGRARGRIWRDLRHRGPAFRSFSERAGWVGIEPWGRRRVAWPREVSAQHFAHDRGVRRPPVRLL